MRRSIRTCLNLGPCKARGWSPPAAHTVGMASWLLLAVRMDPSRYGTETSVWVSYSINYKDSCWNGPLFSCWQFLFFKPSLLAKYIGGEEYLFSHCSCAFSIPWIKFVWGETSYSLILFYSAVHYIFFFFLPNIPKSLQILFTVYGIATEQWNCKTFQREYKGMHLQF